MPLKISGGKPPSPTSRLSFLSAFCSTHVAVSLSLQFRESKMPISPDVTLGKDVRIFHPELVNLYGCSIADETRIGSFVEIQKNAAIGARCKISSHTFICEGVTIEDEVFVGHGVMFTN